MTHASGAGEHSKVTRVDAVDYQIGLGKDDGTRMAWNVLVRLGG